MRADTPSDKHRRPFRIGPVTILALIGSAGILLAGRFAKPVTPDPNAGRIIFEADNKGKLHRVESLSRQRLHSPHLWKPEPGLLLEHTLELSLNSRQRREIELMNSAWLSEKAQLEKQISQAESDASIHIHGSNANQNNSTLQVTGNLIDYSRLSREYDEHRAYSWRRSLSLLSTSQQENLGNITKNIGSE